MDIVSNVLILRNMRKNVAVQRYSRLTGDFLHISDFTYLAESYVSSLNNGSTPSIPSIINHIVEAEFIREKESITTHYRKKMNERLVKPMSVEELDDFSEELRSEVMKRFKKHKVLQNASNTEEMERKLTVSTMFKH